MAVVTGAMGSLVPKVLQLLEGEYKLQKGVRKQVRSLADELKSMHVALSKVAQVPYDRLDPKVKLWASEVREASYDMEDVIDNFLVCVDGGNHPTDDKAKVKRLLEMMGKMFSLTKFKARHEIAGAIEDVKEQVDEMAKRRERYRVDDHVAKSSTMASIDPRVLTLHTTSEIVGIDESRDELIKMLTLEDEDASTKKMKIVSIVGSGGLGKTTLAKVVYQKLTQNMNIQWKAFVPVGQKPELKKVLRDILLALNKGYYMNKTNFMMLEEGQLIEEIQDFLLEKRYFIVIDDVWEVASWNAIRVAFKVTNLGSKVMITTRSNDVANLVDCSYQMKPLPPDSSKLLFYGRIFGSQDKCPERFLELSDKILKKCGGVPLAIITIASLLANKSDEITEWQEVCNSIGTGLSIRNDMYNDMIKILLLSYYYLPPHIQTCFIYLSTYPEDHEIQRDRLIWRWICEGFIQTQKTNEDLFELGKSYFNDLMNRSLVQPVGTMDSNHGIYACRVHDMILDMICFLSKEKNFVTISADIEQVMSSNSKKVRRLSLQNTIWPKSGLSQVRSVVVFQPSIDSLPSFSCFHVLRVLDLEGCSLKKCQDSMLCVGNLIHLRYMGLSGTGLEQVPRGIEKLHFLEVLKMSWGIKLPISVFELKQLMCLEWFCCHPRPGNLLRNLASLMVLDELYVDNESAGAVEELGHLTQLTKLKIQINLQMNQSISEAFINSLGNLPRLQDLWINFDYDLRNNLIKWECWVPPSHLRILQIDGDFSLFKVPKWISPASLPHLRHLHLFEVNTVRPEDIQVIGSLPNLSYLFLLGNNITFKECPLQKFTVSADAFPRVIECYIYYVVAVPSMFTRGAMPGAEHIGFSIRAMDFSSDGGLSFDDLAMDHLPSLLSINTHVHWGTGVSKEEVTKLKDALKHAADVHPNYPRMNVDMSVQAVAKILNSEQKNSTDQQISGRSSNIREVLTKTLFDCQMYERRQREAGASGSQKVISRNSNFEPPLPSMIKSIIKEVLDEGGQGDPEGGMDADVSSSRGAMGSLIRKLYLLVSSQYQLPLPLKDVIQLLKQNLEEINTCLINLLGVKHPNMIATYWMNAVRDLSYDIEDYIISAMHSNFNGITSEEIEEFATLVMEAHERYDRYRLGTSGTSNASKEINLQGWVPMLNWDTKNIISICDLKEKLIDWLNDRAGQHVKIASILGPCGVGKSTLATDVYSEVEGQFDCKAFVRASRTPDTRRLLRSIISQVQQRRPPYTCSVEDLIDILRKCLQHKRCFIVIDGLCETTSWDIISSAFPECARFCRILITTDIEEVAQESCSSLSGKVFMKPPLGIGDSMELFNKFFTSKHDYTQQLRKVSEEYIRRCGGLPLAVISIAGVLSSKLDLADHVQKCLCSIMEKNLTSEDMLREIVCLNYNSLSYDLKTCLLYLSMCPEGYIFMKADLVKQWTAEGFIKAGEYANEVAECNFDKLVRRGFIQPYHINFSDEVLFYTVHSTVFEVISCKSIEDNFNTVIDYSETIPLPSANVRRLSLSFSNAKYATKPEGITMSTVRSLNFYGLVDCLPSITEFKVLRVLILEIWGDQEELDISGIGGMFQLKYVRINTDMTVKLPSNMQGLQYLETLEIYARVTTLPSDIIDLPNLLHFCLEGEINLPHGIGRMRSVRTLRFFDLSSNSEENVCSIGEMENMHDLHLTCSTAQSGSLKRKLVTLASSIGKLGNLKSVILAPDASCPSIYSDCSSCVSSPPVFLQILELLPPVCMFSRLPKWIRQLQKLRILKITVLKLTSDDIEGIARLQELIVLSLFVRQPTAESIVFDRGTFPALKYFTFRCGVPRLDFREEAMPGLRRLKVEFNAYKRERLSNMIMGIDNLLNLEVVTARIGAATSAEESDRMAAESVIKNAVSQHSRTPRINIRIVDWVD